MFTFIIFCKEFCGKNLRTWDYSQRISEPKMSVSMFMCRKDVRKSGVSSFNNTWQSREDFGTHCAPHFLLGG